MSKEPQIPSYVPSPDNYLVRNYIMEYLNDSIHQLLETKNSNPKIDVLEFFTEYFKSVKQGTHILFREYNFIASTPHNRACFIEKFLETFFSMVDKEEMLKVCDYHALILLLCQDFPLEIIEKTLKIISPDNSTANFKDFIYAFQFQFYYKEFINETKIIYDSIKCSISISSIDESLKSKFIASKFLDSIDYLKSQVNYSFPPKSALKDATQSKDADFEYNNFLKELCNNDKITLTIEKIPIKSQILEFKKTANKPLVEKVSTLEGSVDSDTKNLDSDNKKYQSTITSVDNRNQKSAAVAKLGKKNMNSKESDNSRSTSSDSSSDTDT